MRALVFVLLMVWSGLIAGAAPRFAFLDVPVGWVLDAPGAVSVSGSLIGSRWQAAAIGSLASRLDLTVVVDGASLFRPGVRVQVVRDLLPLQVVVDASFDRLALAATLLLGPVHVNVGRRWGVDGSQWGYTAWGATQWMTILVGLDRADRTIRPMAGIRVQPGRSRLWGVSVVYREGQIRCSVGGSL